MKYKTLCRILFAASGIMITGCAPLATSGPDVVIGGGVYPAPVLFPPLGNPNAFRPGGPNGPGFMPGRPSNPGRPNHPVFSPGNPGGPGNQPPGFNPGTGNPGGNPQPGNNPRPGNQRVPGTAVIP